MWLYASLLDILDAQNGSAGVVQRHYSGDGEQSVEAQHHGLTVAASVPQSLVGVLVLSLQVDDSLGVRHLSG